MTQKNNLQPTQAQVGALVQQGTSLHQQGNFDEAQAIYEKILLIQPNHFDALQLLGVLFAQVKKYSQSVELLSKALEINPNHAGAYNNRGNALKELKRFDEALASYDQAIAINPNHVGAQSNRGIALKELKRFDEALASYDQAIMLKPDYVDACINRGNLLKDLNRFDAALASYDQAIAINSGLVIVLYNRGLIFQELNRFDDALASYDQAIAIDSNHAGAYSDRGVALKNLNRFDEALASYDQAIVLNPNHAGTFSNRGNVLQELKRLDEALASYNQAITINPDHANAHWNASICNLIRGNFKAGWPGYEWRWSHFQCASEPLQTNKPAWDYQKTDQRLLVWAEQGIGDHIFYGSLLSELLEDVPNLLVQIDKRLIPIFTRSLPKIKFYPDDIKLLESDYDVHVAIGSLGKYLRNDEKDCEVSRYGFLKDDQINTLEIKKELMALAPLNNKICGISWSSKSKSTGVGKSITLKYFINTLDLKGYTFVSLQYGQTKDEIKNVRDELGINVISYEKVDNFIDIDGLSSLIQACDTVITVDNVTCQLAGALGKQTHILLTLNPWWGWMMEGDESPWHPSVKLYRQEKIDDWSGAFKKLKTEFKMIDELS